MTNLICFLILAAPIGHQRRYKSLCEDLVVIRGLLRHTNKNKTASVLVTLRRYPHNQYEVVYNVYIRNGYIQYSRKYCIIFGYPKATDTVRWALFLYGYSPTQFSMLFQKLENGDVAMTLEKFSRARDKGGTGRNVHTNRKKVPCIYGKMKKLRTNEELLG